MQPSPNNRDGGISSDPTIQPTGAAEQPTKVRWLVFALACGASWFLYLHRYTFGLIMPELGKEYGWSKEQQGALASVFNITYAAGQIPGGLICDLFGPHLFVSACIVGWSLSLFATTMAGSLSQMYAARLIFGAAQAGCYPGLSKLTRSWIPLRIRTSAQAVIASAFGRGGGACAFFLFASVLIARFGLTWRAALDILVYAGVGFGVLFLLLVRNSPARHPWINAAEQRLIGGAEAPPPASGPRAVLPWKIALRNPNFLLVLFQQYNAAFADSLYVFWIPTFLLEARDMDLKQAGIYASLPLIGGALGGLVGGTGQDVIFNVTGNRRWARSLVGSVGNLLGAVLMLAAFRLSDGRAVMVMLMFSKFFVDMGQPTVWGTITDIAGRHAATAFGIVNTSGSIAGTIAPYFMGAFVASLSLVYGRNASWDALFVLVAMIYLLTAIFWAAIDCTKPIVESG